MVTQIQLGNLFNINGRNILSGGSSSFDTKSLITSLSDAKRLPALKLEDSIKLNESKQDALAELRDILDRFKDASNFLRNPPGVGNAADDVFKYRKTSILSNTAVSGDAYLSVSAQPGAQITNYTIQSIGQLALATKQESNVFAIANPDTQVAFTVGGPGQFTAGTFTLNGQDIQISDGDTLRTVASKFNTVSGQTGVSANILQVTPGQYKLIFTATKTGTANAFDLGSPLTVTSDPSGVLANLTFTTTQPADDAELTVDGVLVTRSSNDISDLIEGVTISLKQTTPALTTLDLKIAPDTELVKNAVTNFADAYNEFKLFFSRQTETNTNGTFTEGAVLGNNGALRNILSGLSAELSRTVSGIAGGNPSRLSDVGLTLTDFPGDDETPFTRNTLTLNAEKLSAAVTSNFEGVRKLFNFDLTSSDGNLQIFSRNNNLSVSSFTLNINPGTTTYQATYDPGTGPVTVDLTATPLGSSGYTLEGQAGTPFDGLKLIYTSTASNTITVNATQGIADRFFNELEEILEDETGLLTTEDENIITVNERLQKEVDRIDRQVESFRETLIAKFAQLEKAISSINTLLQSLNANAEAAANN